MKHIIPILVILLFIISAVSPMVIGFKSDAVNCDVVIAEIVEPESTELSGPMDSAWPMYGHDIRHTGRSPYSTADNSGNEKWRYKFNYGVMSSAVVDSNGTIYIGNDYFFAINPNGTLKWKYNTGALIHSTPAIDENGIIYFGTIYGSPSYLYALYPNGTLKWKFKTGNWVHGSPTISADGTIYIGSDDEYLYALNPDNGSMKWKSKVGAMFASPALDEYGILYFGVWNSKFRAVYSNNGTRKWSFDLGKQNGVWGSSAAISDDGTIYFGTYLDDGSGGGDIIALNSDGSEKWRTRIATDYVWSSPAIAEDGTIYVGSANDVGVGYLHAVCRGELEADANGPYYGLIDEPVQFTGSAQGGYSPHTWHWDFGDTYTSDEQNPTHIYSSPSNYTVTLTVTDDTGNTSDDATWAKIKESNNPPDEPAITGETNGKAGTTYKYDFMGVDPDGDEWVWYYIDWDDGSFEDWIGPYKPGKVVTVGHTWSQKRTYIIRAKTRDNYGGESEWGTLEVTMPKNKPFDFNFSLISWLLERFPILNQIVNLLMEK